MALSIVTVLAQIRDLVATVTGMERVYAAGETDANAIPAALNELPCAMVFFDETIEPYILMSGGQRHHYTVRLQIFESGGDIGSRVNTVLPFVDLIISKFEANVTLGNRANLCMFRRAKFGGLDYNGALYTGFDITLEVQEQAVATPAIGA